MRTVLNLLWIYVFILAIPYIILFSKTSLLIKGVMIYGNFMGWLLPTLVYKWESKLIAKGWKLNNRYFIKTKDEFRWI